MPNVYRAIIYKNREGWIECHDVSWHRKLQAVVWFILAKTAEKVIITSGYRKGDKGVHGTIPLRGLDLSDDRLTDAIGLCDKINKSFRYDPGRPHMAVALYHAICPRCGHNNMLPYHSHCTECQEHIKEYWHIHLQVHPNTIFES